ncbi:MAG: glycine cleavage system protein H [Bdellovibrionales bacterium]|nr:glycine cleavage system protein H [Bdellovibrionales bacterium]
MSNPAEHSGETDQGRIWWHWAGGTLTLGMTGAAISELGEPEEVSLPEEGESLESGDILFSCGGSTGSYEWACPVEGTVSAVNAAVLDDPLVLAEDPLESWLVRIEVVDESQIAPLRSGKKAG